MDNVLVRILEEGEKTERLLPAWLSTLLAEHRAGPPQTIARLNTHIRVLLLSNQVIMGKVYLLFMHIVADKQ